MIDFPIFGLIATLATVISWSIERSDQRIKFIGILNNSNNSRNSNNNNREIIIISNNNNRRMNRINNSPQRQAQSVLDTKHLGYLAT